MPVSLVGVLAPCWVTEEGSSDILKAGELELDAIPPVDVAAPRCMLVEVQVSLHHYAAKIEGTSLEDRSHNLC